MSITWVVEANENKNKENANEKKSCLSIIWVVNTNEKKERRGNNNKRYLSLQRDQKSKTNIIPLYYNILYNDGIKENDKDATCGNDSDVVIIIDKACSRQE